MSKDNKDDIETVGKDLGKERSMEDYVGERYYLLDVNNKYMHKLDLGMFLKPKYALCNTCPFNPDNGGVCEDAAEDEDCIIEKTFFDVLMQSMAEHGVTDEDRLIIFPLAQQLFRLNRLYALELNVDLRKLYNVDYDKGKLYTLDIYKELLKLIESNEKGYIQKLKELLSTRKERSNKRSFKDSSSFTAILLRSEGSEDK